MESSGNWLRLNYYYYFFFFFSIAAYFLNWVYHLGGDNSFFIYLSFFCIFSTFFFFLFWKRVFLDTLFVLLSPLYAPCRIFGHMTGMELFPGKPPPLVRTWMSLGGGIMRVCGTLMVSSRSVGGGKGLRFCFFFLFPVLYLARDFHTMQFLSHPH